MAKDLRGFIGELEVAQELIRVKEELSSQFEVPAAVKIIKNKYDKAILFERVRGYDVPVISNMLGSKEKLAMALGVRESEYEAAYLERKDTFIKPELKEKDLPGEVSIDKDVDILKVMPILTHSEKDAAPYLSSSFTVARDPETGMLGMGLHRIQVRSKDEINIWLLSPPLSIFLEKAEAMNQPLEVAVVNGVHPAVFMASVIKAPTGVNKFEMAGGLMQRPVEMIKCKTVDLEVPADAEFVLEGAILSHKKEKDGPFGESSGFYVATGEPGGKDTPDQTSKRSNLSGIAALRRRGFGASKLRPWHGVETGCKTEVPLHKRYALQGPQLYGHCADRKDVRRPGKANC